VVPPCDKVASWYVARADADGVITEEGEFALKKRIDFKCFTSVWKWGDLKSTFLINKHKELYFF